MTITFPPVDEQMRRILRGAAEVFPEDELRKKLERSRATGKPLRIKLGVDPTAPDIHLGNAVPMWKLRAFQEMGHVAVLIVGDYTARIGDPSGRNALRPPLDEATVDANAQTYFDQARLIVLPQRLELRRNSEWLGKMAFMDIVRLTSRATVAQMLKREDFARRWATEESVATHELLYPLMQGWDSVVVQADVELGGTDQRFNLLVGRDLQRDERQEPQVVLTLPLVPGTDGVRKMSKSTGNYIGITESPDQQFGKTMSIPDALMQQWFAGFTEVPEESMTRLLDPAQTHPRDAKEALAKAIVTRYHGDAAAEAAAASFRSVFSQGAAPAEMPDVTVPAGPVNVVTLVVLSYGATKSRSEARRLVEQGAVSLGDAKLADPKAAADPADGAVLKVGKKDFFRVRRGSGDGPQKLKNS